MVIGPTILMNPDGTIEAQCEVPDIWFDTKTPEEIKTFIEDWCRNNWLGERGVSVCPLLDGHIVLGVLMTDEEWRQRHG